MIEILFIGDVVGDPGIKILSRFLPAYRRKYQPDLIAANGENLHTGKSLTPAHVRQMNEMGVEILTSGNHIWDRFQAHDVLARNPRVLRPLNYPQGVAGSGVARYITASQKEIIVINAQGRTFLPPIDCPFRTLDRELRRFQRGSQVILLDFHAEATAEKQALAWHLDGRISAFVGTHTHVQTADERILPKGTAYITDVGMTGARDSVIGMKKEVAIKRFLYHTPFKYEPALDDPQVAAVRILIDEHTFLAHSITRILWRDGDKIG
jgi:metallophosphoesterase (TIGR00282 family)